MKNARQKALDLLAAYMNYEFGIDPTPDYAANGDEVYGLMYTTVDGSDGVEHEVQASVNLTDPSMLYYVDNKLVDTIKYESLEDLIDKELSDFASDPEVIFDYYYGQVAKYVD